MSVLLFSLDSTPEVCYIILEVGILYGSQGIGPWYPSSDILTSFLFIQFPTVCPAILLAHAVKFFTDGGADAFLDIEHGVLLISTQNTTFVVLT